MRPLALAIGLIAGLIAAVATARGATLHTVDGAPQSGTLISCDGKSLTFSVNGKPADYPLDDIVRIELSPPAPSRSDAAASPDTTARPHPRIIRNPRHLAAIEPTTQMLVASHAKPVSTPATTPPTATTKAASSDVIPRSLPGWRIALASGDALHGTLTAWTDRQVSLRLDASSNDVVTLPTESIRSLWHGSPADQTTAEALATPPDQDAAFVRKSPADPIVAVQGSARRVAETGAQNGVESDDLLFRYGDDVRKIAISKLIGVRFAAGAATQPADAKLFEVFQLADGERLSGTWRSLADGAIELAVGDQPPSRLAMSSVRTIEFRNGRVIYLSDLVPAAVEQTPFFDRLIPYRTDASLDGGPIRLSDGAHDVAYDKGLAMHSRCVLGYDLPDNAERFRATIGFEPGSPIGEASVRVIGDGRAVFSNDDLRGGAPAAPIDLSISGVKRLSLEVDFGKGQGVEDRVDWAEARIVRAKEPTP